ncbi:hypothetical protein IW139_006346 [Coemansia sp. RSA 353]|nr:hypothetical protein EV181_006706 [Coemansia sp. RSA 532]KAJ2185566.1 hypothetical protein IW144_006439 [Coemansia sp. RSA 522]KAJ2204675.1 hypothetical protein EV180_007382 [Coemansia sp. RSA 518]KAJ2266451.1 hypothetical protein J3F81_005471 [Coemansia sp. RSA 371]KAJ2285205.1 hypothetical protein IW139_006346 [Coemansia sp. RSA 353]
MTMTSLMMHTGFSNSGHCVTTTGMTLPCVMMTGMTLSRVTMTGMTLSRVTMTGMMLFRMMMDTALMNMTATMLCRTMMVTALVMRMTMTYHHMHLICMTRRSVMVAMGALTVTIMTSVGIPWIDVTTTL